LGGQALVEAGSEGSGAGVGAKEEVDAAESVAGGEAEAVAVVAEAGAEVEGATAGVVTGAEVEAAGAGAVAGAVAEVGGAKAVAGVAAEAGGAVAWAWAGAAVAVAGTGAEAEVANSCRGGGKARRAVGPEPWWAVVDSSTVNGVSGAMELGEALRAFVVTVGVDGAEA
jgi:hypothetical protein